MRKVAANQLVTLCACARGKAIGFVRLFVCLSVSTKIARSKHLGVIMRYKYHKVETVEKTHLHSSKRFIRVLERYKSHVSISHAFRPHLLTACAVSNAHA